MIGTKIQSSKTSRCVGGYPMCWTCGGARPKSRYLRKARQRLQDSIARKEVRMDKRIYCTRQVDRVRREENVDGSFWVDQTCIDCDTCRWMAPQIFSAVGAASAVTSQPKTEEERITGLMALLSCPTYSIHSDDATKGEIQKARDSFPTPAFPKSKDVFHLGFHDEASFGAASYLIRRPGGNVMFDVPRWNPSLASRIEKLGGVRYIILSHKDDVAAHQKYASRFGATRIIHSSEANSRQGTEKAEWKLEGEGPWMICNDIEIIHTPGHTEGHIVALYHPENVLFTGDHLGYSGRTQNLSIFRRYNRHSIGAQIESIIKLIDLDFNWILPGHGRRWHFHSGSERKGQLEDLVAREKTYI